MEFLKNLWEWLQGKKTAIGALLLLLVQQTWFLGILPDGTVEDAVLWVLGIIGSLLTGVGIIGMINKGVKGQSYSDLLKENEKLKNVK